MENGKMFKTKMGFCQILPDKIVLTRDEISRIVTLYGGMSLVFFCFAVDNYLDGKIILSILSGLVGIGCTYEVISSIKNSAAPIIDRQKIKEVKFKKSIVGFTRSRFEVLFEDEQGKSKKRLIIPSVSLKCGQSETEKALKIMTDEKIITNR